MSGWRDVTLGDVCELKRGYDLPRDSRAAGSIPVISSSGPTGWHDEAKVKAPGVVTGRYAGTLSAEAEDLVKEVEQLSAVTGTKDDEEPKK